MCDVLDEVEQRGIALGINQGITKIVKKLYGKNYTTKEIAKMIDEEEKEVEAILQRA